MWVATTIVVVVTVIIAIIRNTETTTGAKGHMHRTWRIGNDGWDGRNGPIFQTIRLGHGRNDITHEHQFGSIGRPVGYEIIHVDSLMQLVTLFQIHPQHTAAE